MKYDKDLTEIKKDIEEMFEIEDLSLRYRGRDLVMYRYLYMNLARKFTNKVMHGLRQFEILLPYYKDINDALIYLDNKYTIEIYNKHKYDDIEVSYCNLLKNLILTQKQIKLNI